MSMKENVSKKDKPSVYGTVNREPEVCAKQSFRDECNVNKIIDRYTKTGVLTHVKQLQSVYGEFNTDSLQEAFAKVEAANNMFMQLPSALRKLCEHDPVKVMEFVQNPDNYDKLVEMGLAEQRAKPAKQTSEANPVTTTTEVE